jgi:3-methylcrotonyl-CoA carboxylase alpha subunit
MADPRREGRADPSITRDIYTGWRLSLGGGAMEARQLVILTDDAGDSEEFRVGPVKAGEHYEVIAENGEALMLAARELKRGRWRVSEGGAVHMVTVRRSPGVIEIDTPEGCVLYRPAPALAFAESDTAADRAVISPLTGLIVDVKVVEDQTVSEGEVIAVMESMKLEISIRAPAAGIVKNIVVTKGAMVDRGRVIAEILPPEEAGS